jgi:hypothetical protein
VWYTHQPNTVGIILNIFKISGSHILYMMLFPHGLMKSHKNDVLWKSKFGRFLYGVFAIIRITWGWPFLPNSKLMRVAAGGSGSNSPKGLWLKSYPSWGQKKWWI